MSRSAAILPWVVLAVWLPLGQPFCPAALAEPPQFERDVKPLLGKYCLRCHGEQEKKEGDFDLSAIPPADNPAAVDAWERVLGRFNAAEMPPADEPQPNDGERSTLGHFLEHAIRQREGDCRKLASDKTQNFYRGYVMSRRLTRAEYDHSIRDLLGVDLQPSRLLPGDGSGGEGFDTSGDTLFTSPILLEKYLEAADVVLRALLPDPLDPPLGGPRQEELAAARARLLTAQPAPELPAHEAAKRILSPLMRRAFRRPVTEPEVERPLALFDHAQARGDSFDASLRLALKAVLVSPHFLFLVEREPATEGVYRLGPYELATRLAYFLWGSIPDEELLSAAAQGNLDDPEKFRRQTARLLADPKSRGLADSFARQWLGIDGLGVTVRPDGSRYPEFDGELVTAMQAEAVLLVDGVFRENRSLLELLNADYTYLNERLAQHYHLPEVKGAEMRRVALADRNRGGVVTLGAVLTMTSYPLRTSPVLRGKWVLDQVLGAKVPMPPPNVPELPKDDAQEGAVSLRQRLEKHRVDPSCATCHDRLDPPGFGLENFDPLGRWRDRYSVLIDGQLKPEGPPVDAAVKLPSGESFQGPAELKEALVRRQDEFLRNFVRKMLGYALGRELNRFDQCVVDQAIRSLKAHELKSSYLIESIVESFPFQHRYCKK